MNIQNIIFDLGGVVIAWDPDGIIAKFTQDADLAVKLKRDIFDHQDWVEKDRGLLSEAEVNKRFAERTGLAEAHIIELMQIVLDSLQLEADILLLMDELRQQGLHLYCLSNMPVEHYAHLQRLYDIWDKFDGIVVSGQVEMVKPQPEIYQYLLREFKLSPQTCIFIDDSPKNIEVAQSQGIHGVLYNDINSCREQLKQLGVLN